MRTTFRYTNPVLPSTDVARDIAWYTENLGFQRLFSHTDPELNQVSYAGLGRQNQYIHLQFQWPKDMAQMNGSSIRFEVENIQPYFQECIQRGAVGPEKLRENTPWGTNEFGLYDPNKNAIVLPVPVCARPVTSLPSIAKGMALVWMGVSSE